MFCKKKQLQMIAMTGFISLGLSEPLVGQQSQKPLTNASALFPGEYAVVLRPVSKSKAFSGGDVARAQGDGLIFDALWTFQIADSAG